VKTTKTEDLLIHRICMALSGLRQPPRLLNITSPSAAALVLSWKVRKFWMLWKMPLPSSMALRMVLKSSSVRIMSAASLATSVPSLPMLMPMSAFFSAGASFTPSPVIATTSPRLCRAWMILSLWSGLVRAKMETRFMHSASSASLMWSSWSPLRTGEPSAEFMLIGMPSLFAMATAVTSASPVIMMTLTPPAIKRRMLRATPGRGGSDIPTRPAKVRPV
jgi:hypothetical protein